MKEESSRNANRLLLVLGVLSLLGLYLGYDVGKSLALRDNRAEACAAKPGSCADLPPTTPRQ